MSICTKSTKNTKTVPAAVTPIATYRRDLESEEKHQTTMTQFIQKWRETTFSSSDDEDSVLSSDLLVPPIKRTKRSKMAREAEGEKCEKKCEDEEDTVVDAEEVPLKALDASIPQPGDLVMSTAEKVQHPAYNFN